MTWQKFRSSQLWSLQTIFHGEENDKISAIYDANCRSFPSTSRILETDQSILLTGPLKGFPCEKNKSCIGCHPGTQLNRKIDNEKDRVLAELIPDDCLTRLRKDWQRYGQVRALRNGPWNFNFSEDDKEKYLEIRLGKLKRKKKAISPVGDIKTILVNRVQAVLNGYFK